MRQTMSLSTGPYPGPVFVSAQAAWAHVSLRLDMYDDEMRWMLHLAKAKTGRTLFFCLGCIEKYSVCAFWANKIIF